MDSNMMATFRLSAAPNVSGSAPELFGEPGEFSVFGAPRLFGMTGGNMLEVKFMDPVHPSQPATVDGFGAVFTGNELAGSTFIEFYDQTGLMLHRTEAPVTSGGGLSFAGATFADSVIAMVRISSGTVGIDMCGMEMMNSTADCVAMDDFIYGEPQPTGPMVDFVDAGSDSASSRRPNWDASSSTIRSAASKSLTAMSCSTSMRSRSSSRSR